MGIDARNSYIAVFQRLAQGFQRGAAEFWQFIQKQDAVVCERNFSGGCFATAADQSRSGGGMMRVAIRAAETKFAVFQFAGNGMNHAGLKRFFGSQRRQNGRQTGGQHGFSGAGRAYHQQVVSARGCDFQSPLGAFLSFDVTHIKRRFDGHLLFGLWKRQGLQPLEVVNQAQQTVGRKNIFQAGPDGFRSAGSRANQSFFGGIGVNGHRQNAVNGNNRAVQPEFTEGNITGKLFLGNDTHAGQ